MNQYQKKITELREKLGDDLVIMGHHYQNDAVIRHVDLTGDSLELARKVTTIDAKHIVFCGVYFMGESAALLADEHQHVYLPEDDANCVMSQMAPYTLVDKVLTRINKESGRKVVPLTYVNSSVAVKAVCGKHGGTVCTSANAEKMVRWAMERGDSVLFLPDKNLARNTAKTIGIPEEKWHILNIKGDGTQIDMDAVSKSELIMWPGCCAIHARFNERQIEEARTKYPDVKIVIHPESAPNVVDKADAAGSTSFIIKYVEEAPEGSNIAIGTELNLVERLADQYEGSKNIFPLLESTCSHMARVTEPKLAKVLEDIVNGTAKPVTIPAGLVEDAKIALERMLIACA
ncbi:quinolinate synthase NadA [Halodesulfovibrio marinisediminis]|uniref:Quinolinate synthase n=1 Tax=Halodesulfovibrio marinisediminis DSM 17456 TaxID=1121457 RepID=A0A1N6I550_9BACT|nr:quinolinate synthase NadA [Halodesulfovibrio marinisediminis]SIO27045.1 quinolinate synthetase [Halodesulfovibrio marinisediminis DSM 17456]